VKRKLGAGCFGEVYSAVNSETGQEVAVKLEDTQHHTAQLFFEAELLANVSKDGRPQGFSELFWVGKEGKHNCMVMEMLGRSLEDLNVQCGGRFNTKTTALIAEQVLMRIEFLHSKGYVHRDIKPENFLSGVQNRMHHIYLIDFGLSKKYWDRHGRHIAMRQRLNLTGTARYASINAHEGTEQSRRDDLEAISHMLVYFLRGKLPWSGLEARTKSEKYKKIMEKKREVPLEELCVGFPEAFQELLRYARDLQFVERPDYDLLQGLVRGVREQEGVKQDYEFQWLEQNASLLQVSLDSLAPLEKRSRLAQPDDVVTHERQPGDRRRKLMQCFCVGRGKENVESKSM